MSHRARLRRKHQPVDAAILHAFELALHRARDLLVADRKLSAYRLSEVGDLLPAVGLRLCRRGGEMIVRADDHLFALLVKVNFKAALFRSQPRTPLIEILPTT